MRPIILTTRQHSPCNPCQLIGKCNDKYIAMSPAFKRIHPCSDRSSISLDAENSGACTVHEDLAQATT